MHTPWHCVLLTLALGFWACSQTGCDTREVGSPGEGGSSAAGDATGQFDSRFATLVATYAKARTYRDQATLHIEYAHRDEGLVRTSQELASVVVERPNRLRIERTAVTNGEDARLERLVLSDGRRLYVTVSELPGQLLEVDAPLRIDLDALLSDPTARAAVLPFSVEALYPQLELLMSKTPLKRILSEAKSKRVATDAEHEGVVCHRLEIETDEGTYVYWIDCENGLLRRVDLPVQVVADLLDPDRQLRQMKVWLDLADAQLDPTLPAETFVLQPPETCVRVTRFVTSHPGPAPVGPDFTTRDRDAYDAAVLAYHRELSEAAIEGQSFLIDAAAPQLASRSEFNVLRSLPRWTNTDVIAPGNITVVDRGGAAERLLVVEGLKTVVELDLASRELARHELDLAAGDGVSFVRTIVDGQQRRWYLASGNARQQLHVYDESFKHVFSYPSGGTHDGIADAQFGDLDGDGMPEVYVGYWGAVGVQGVGLDGKRLWSDRSLEHVLHLTTVALTPGRGNELWCVNGRGTLARFSFREKLGELKVGDRVLIDVAFADVDGDGVPDGCGLAFNDVGKYEAVGIDREGQELWAYPLPEGEFRTQTERIVVAQIPGRDGGWLIPAADGSLHVLSATGDLVDRMNHGRAINGVATARSGNEVVLVIADSEGLTAWTLEQSP